MKRKRHPWRRRILVAMLALLALLLVPVPSVVEVAEPPRLLVTRIPEDAGIGFHGGWTYEIEAADGGASLRITERGEVDNPVFRIVSLLFNQRATLNRFLTDLGTRFGETVTPVPETRMKSSGTLP